MEFFLLCGENYVGNDALGKQCHDRRKALEKNLYSHNAGLYEALGRSLAGLGIGREFVVVAKKDGGMAVPCGDAAPPAADRAGRD
jgi:hypothetical protein